MKREKMNI